MSNTVSRIKELVSQYESIEGQLAFLDCEEIMVGFIDDHDAYWLDYFDLPEPSKRLSEFVRQELEQAKADIERELKLA